MFDVAPIYCNAARWFRCGGCSNRRGSLEKWIAARDAELAPYMSRPDAEGRSA
jgi:hypothetical protein